MFEFLGSQKLASPTEFFQKSQIKFLYRERYTDASKKTSPPLDGQHFYNEQINQESLIMRKGAT